MAAEERGSFLDGHDLLIARLYARSGAPRWTLPAALFAEALERSVHHRFRGERPRAAEVAAYLEALQVEDLALAASCAEGIEPAWEYFIEHQRRDLYAAANAIAGAAAARELADSLYGELFGLEERGGRRRSLFRYFHGRSRLSTWLRSVLAQRHVDLVRSARRMEPLGEEDRIASAEPGADDPDRARYLDFLRAALADALEGLTARDRLRLASYYAQDLTLAQVGRLLGEHESTVSRKLDRTRRDLRQRVHLALSRERRLNEAQIQLCYEYALQEWPFDLTGLLSDRAP